jgi:hypothetical protein
MKPSEEKDRLILNATPKQLRSFDAAIYESGDCRLFRRVDARGYGRVSLFKVSVKAHRMALVRHVGAVCPGLVVRHKCRNRNCVALVHLEFGTIKDNARDRYRDGTMKAPRYGADHNWAKYSKEQVVDVYVAYARGGTTYAKAGAIHGMSPSYAELIVRRKIWADATRHLPNLNFDPRYNRAKGVRHAKAVLTEYSVRRIREDGAKDGKIAACKRLAASYGVKWQTIYSIRRGQSWRHLV